MKLLSGRQQISDFMCATLNRFIEARNLSCVGKCFNEQPFKKQARWHMTTMLIVCIVQLLVKRNGWYETEDVKW